MTGLLCLIAQEFPSTMPVPESGINLLLILVPAACLIIGFGFGSSLTKLAMFGAFRDHLDKHFFSSHPDTKCLFCREERGIRQEVRE